MWAIGRFASLNDFFDTGRELGFTQFELNHAVNGAMLAGCSLDGQIASIHEPCPADPPTRVLKRYNWLMSAPDEEKRRLGVQAIQRSIDLAVQLGVPVVVVHPGQVDMDPAQEDALWKLYEKGRVGKDDYVQAQERLVAARAAQAPINMRSVRRSILELAEYADRAGVRLGLENRYHYRQIPLIDELDDLLNLGCGETVGYWHDVGHGQVMEHLGFGPQEEWLRRFAGRMVGIHLHDVVDLQDHQVAGAGAVDWDMIARYLPPDAQRTCEFHSDQSPEQVAAGLRWLIDKGFAGARG